MMMWEGFGVNSVYPTAVNNVLVGGRKVTIDRPEAVNSDTLEVSPGIFNITNPRRRLVTSFGRPVNVPFMLAEVLWILAGRRDVEMLKHYNSTIEQFSDNGLYFNAAYGHRLRSAFGHDQIEDAIRTLQDDRSSRQAVMVISNPVDDKGWNRVLAEDADDPTRMVYTKKQTKDRACNLLSHMLIRDDRLDWMQVLRSNDIMWGTPYNFMQFTHLQEYMAQRLGVGVGRYTHIAHSLHMYAHHYKQAESVQEFDLYAHHGHDHRTMRTDSNTMNIVFREELSMRTERSYEVGYTPDNVGRYWTAVLDILRAWKAYKADEDGLALDILGSTPDLVLAPATARFMYQNRWHKREHRMISDSIQDVFDVHESQWIKSRVED